MDVFSSYFDFLKITYSSFKSACKDRPVSRWVSMFGVKTFYVPDTLCSPIKPPYFRPLTIKKKPIDFKIREPEAQKC